MMSETPQTVVRVTFLLGATLLFAAAWQGDHAPGPRTANAGLAATDQTRRPARETAPLPGEPGEIVLRHDESETNRDDRDRSDNRSSSALPGPDRPQDTSDSPVDDGDRTPPVSVPHRNRHTLSFGPGSRQAPAAIPSAGRELRDMARTDLPRGITAGSYQVVDNTGRSTQLTLTGDDLTADPRSARPIYETSPMPGRRVYWIRIERSRPQQSVASSSRRDRSTAPGHPPRSTTGDSVALLTGSIDRTPPATARWFKQARRWMGRAIELVRTQPDEPAGVRR